MTASILTINSLKIVHKVQRLQKLKHKRGKVVLVDAISETKRSKGRNRRTVN